MAVLGVLIFWASFARMVLPLPRPRSHTVRAALIDKVA
jgi:hypothetical protein